VHVLSSGAAMTPTRRRLSGIDGRFQIKLSTKPVVVIHSVLPTRAQRICRRQVSVYAGASPHVLAYLELAPNLTPTRIHIDAAPERCDHPQAVFAPSCVPRTC